MSDFTAQDVLPYLENPSKFMLRADDGFSIAHFVRYILWMNEGEDRIVAQKRVQSMTLEDVSAELARWELERSIDK